MSYLKIKCHTYQYLKTSVTRRYHIGDVSWHAVGLSGKGSAKGGIMQKTKVDKNDVQKVDVP